MTPKAYKLKQVSSMRAARFWRGDMLDRIEAAPIYFFPDDRAFNSDDVEVAARRLFFAPRRLPHPITIFEVNHPTEGGSVIACAHQRDDTIEAAVLMFYNKENRFSDVYAVAELVSGGLVNVEVNPKTYDNPLSEQLMQCMGAILWRALAILATKADVESKSIPAWRRPSMARKGVCGWTYHQVTVDLERLPKSEPQGGTHASPRWHIRRGHWREMSDGRRVFVRQCEVGNPAHGGVVKDYIVGAQP